MRHLTQMIETTIRYVRQWSSYDDFAVVELVATPAHSFSVNAAQMVVHGNLGFSTSELVELIAAFSTGASEACQRLDVAGVSIVIRSIRVHPVDTHKRSFLEAGRKLEHILATALRE